VFPIDVQGREIRTASSSAAANNCSVTETKVGVCRECGGPRRYRKRRCEQCVEDRFQARLPAALAAVAAMRVERARSKARDQVCDWVGFCETLAPPAKLFAELRPYDVTKLANLDGAIAWLTALRTHVEGGLPAGSASQ
jgi:hypothetical protein